MTAAQAIVSDAPHKCHFCRLYQARKRLPKTYDFSMKHAYSRYGIGEHVEEVPGAPSDVHVYNMPFEELKRQHPDWMVTDWIYVCDACEPYVHHTPESENRLFRFIEHRIGKEEMEKAVEQASKNLIVPIMDAIIEQQKKQKRLEKRRLRQPSGFYSGVVRNE